MQALIASGKLAADRFTFLHPDAGLVLGHPIEQLLGARWQQYTDKGDLKRLIHLLAQVAASPRLFRCVYRFERSDRQHCRILAVGFPVFDSSCSEVVVSMADVTHSGVELDILVRLEANLRSFPRASRTGSRIPTVSFDMDGVLTNTFQAVLDKGFEANTRYPYSWTELHCSAVHDHDCAASVCLKETARTSLRQLNLSEFEQAKADAIETPGFWANLEPFAGEDIELIAEGVDAARYAAVFVANRADTKGEEPPFSDARIQSINWLVNHGIRQYVHTSFDCIDKVTELLFRGVDYHVDDDPFEVERLRAAGIEAFLVTRPWNRHIDCEFRVESIGEFLDIVIPVPVEELVEASEGWHD